MSEILPSEIVQNEVRAGLRWREGMTVDDLAEVVRAAQESGHGADPVLLIATPGTCASWLGKAEVGHKANTLDLMTLEAR